MSPPPGGIALRPLTAADAGAFRDFRLAALLDAPDAFGSTHERERDFLPERHAERLAASLVAMGAFDGPELVGFAAIRRGSGPKEGHKGALWGVHVEPGHRRRGIGAAVVRAACEAARGRVEQVHLSVTVGGAAVHLYEALGFERYGLEPRSLKAHGRYHDEALMVLVL